MAWSISNNEFDRHRCYSHKDIFSRRWIVHQSRVSPCPIGFPAGYYWYGGKTKGPGHPPKWLEHTLQQTHDTELKEQMDSESNDDSNSGELVSQNTQNNNDNVQNSDRQVTQPDLRNNDRQVTEPELVVKKRTWT